MLRRITLLTALSLFLYVFISAQAPTTVEDFFLPGSQPNQSGNFESPNKCDNCHGGYDKAVEPAFNWRGSMMAQAARDPLFYACLTIAEQDAPGAGDLCLRCHTPTGWLEGRSDPTDGSAITSADRESVHCDFCHRTVKPTEIGVNPYPGDADYTSGTYPNDQGYLATLDSIPETSADGMFIVDADNTKRGPFVETVARHQFYYSPFHKEAAICGTCHDVSNPAFTVDGNGKYQPNNFDESAPDYDPYSMFPIERTYSEWLFSDYNTTTGVYAPQFGGNKDTVHTCQDCHMRDVTGVGCNKSGAPVRDDLPLHDLTGGNTFIPNLIEAVFPGETDPETLDSGIVRARSMLQKAASMNLSASAEGDGYHTDVMITNETGHKLPSGYPEGRRIWINVKAFNQSGTLIYESGAYDSTTGILTHDDDVKIYQIKPGLSTTLAPVVGYDQGPSFHFAVNDTVYSDNRIPPRGFTNSNYEMIGSPIIDYSYPDGQYWDNTEYVVPLSTAQIIVTLYYQTTSKDYVEFLRDENSTNNWGDTLYSLWVANGKSAPEAMNVDTLNVPPIGTNQPPVVADIPDQTINEGETFTSINLDDYVTDPDNADSQIVWTASGNVELSVDITDRVATITTPDADWYGAETITFTATDPESESDSDPATFTVTAVNDPPVVTDIPDQTKAEGDSFDPINLDDYVSDVDNADSQMTWTASGQSQLTVDITDRVATITPPTPDWNGSETITFRATDPGSLFDEDAATFTVTAVNDPPVVTDIPDQTKPEGDSFDPITLDDYVSDVDNADSQMTWTASGQSQLTVDIIDRVATITPPTPDWNGSETITFRATDPGSLFDEDAATFTVTAVNDPPVVTDIPDQTIAEGASFDPINLDDYVSDVDNADSQMTWTATGQSQLTVDIIDRVATITPPTPDWNGSETITFRATDPGTLFDEDAATFTVTGVGDPPVVSGIPDQTIAEGELFASITLDDYVTDADNADSQMTWTASGQIDLNVDIADRVATITAPSPDWNGSETITFRATDPDLLFDEDAAVFTATPVNDTPVIAAIEPQTVAEASLLTFEVSATDVDGTTPGLDVFDLPTGAIFTPHGDGTATFEWTPDYDQAGLHTVGFVASDGLAADTERVDITVTNTNRPPVLDPLTNQSVTVDENLQFTVSGSDPDGEIPSILSSPLPSGASLTDHHDGTGTFDWTPISGQEGLYDITFRAADDEDTTDQTIQIEVQSGLSYVCGDANGDGQSNISDAVHIINWIFKGGPSPDPLEAGDADCNGTNNISDAVRIVDWVFKGGDPPCCPTSVIFLRR